MSISRMLDIIAKLIGSNEPAARVWVLINAVAKTAR